jgi:hypothetical protein
MAVALDASARVRRSRLICSLSTRQSQTKANRGAHGETEGHGDAQNACQPNSFRELLRVAGGPRPPAGSNEVSRLTNATYNFYDPPRMGYRLNE